MPKHVRTVQANNSTLIAEVAKLYLPDGARVADVTWGHGVFWRRFNGSRRFTLIGSDLRPLGNLVADFRQLPYADGSMDVIVLDPPYMHYGHYINDCKYGNSVNGNLRHPEVMALYRAGMREAQRVLRRGGTLWIKCKDENDHKQNWAHITIHQIGQELGFQAIDLFVLASRPAPTRRWLRQHHALKTHSYLWVFRQPMRRQARRRR
jgi:hypothetical protein